MQRVLSESRRTAGTDYQGTTTGMLDYKMRTNLALYSYRLHFIINNFQTYPLEDFDVLLKSIYIRHKNVEAEKVDEQVSISSDSRHECFS